MTKSQRFITDFFKSKKSQRLITDYYKPSALIQPKEEMKSYRYKSVIDYQQSRRYLQKYKHLVDAAQTKNGYYFCAQANYTEYSVHTTIDRLLIVNNEKILVSRGACVATAMVDSDSALEHVSVENLFRRQGIGKNLIRFINKHDTQFHVFGGVEHNSRYRLTEEGAALIQSCQRAGILDEEQVILSFVPNSPHCLR